MIKYNYPKQSVVPAQAAIEAVEELAELVDELLHERTQLVLSTELLVKELNELKSGVNISP